MFPLLDKMIETRPSNNVTYAGSLNKYNSKVSKRNLHSTPNKDKTDYHNAKGK